MTQTWQTASDITKAHFVILHDTLQMLSVLSAAATKVHYFNLVIMYFSLKCGAHSASALPPKVKLLTGFSVRLFFPCLGSIMSELCWGGGYYFPSILWGPAEQDYMMKRFNLHEEHQSSAFVLPLMMNVCHNSNSEEHGRENRWNSALTACIAC